MNKEEKDRLIRYGNLIMDFVNGKNSDEVLTKHIANLNAAFGLSKNFVHRMSQAFPTLKKLYRRYSTDELLLIRFIYDQEQMMWKLFREFNDCSYDREHKIFTFYSYPDAYDDNEEEKSYEISLNDLIEDKKQEPCYEYSDGSDEKRPIDVFLDYELKIEELKPKSPDRFRELVNMCNRVVYVEELHKDIKCLQADIINILDEFVSAKNVYTLSGIKSIVETYNNSSARSIIITSDALKDANKFNYDYFLKQGIKIEKLFNETWCYCFIEIVKHQEYAGRNRIKRCHDCRDFYIQSKLFEKQIYCPVCSKKSHISRTSNQKRVEITRDERAKRKFREKEKEIFAAQCARLIESGYSKSEATQKAKEYASEQVNELKRIREMRKARYRLKRKKY